MTTNELMFLIEEDPEGGYNAKALGQSIFVQGDTFETLKSNIKDALECHFDTKEDIPKIIRLHMVHDEMFAYPKFMVFALILGKFGVLQKYISYNINRIRAAGCSKVVCSAKIYMAGIDRKRFPC